MIRHLHNSQNDHPNKSSAHLTSYIVIKILLTIFPMLYFIFPWLFCNTNLYLVFLPFLPIPHNIPHIWKPSKYSLYLWICFIQLVHLFWFLHSTYKWNLMAFAFLCLIYFTEHNGLKVHIWLKMSMYPQYTHLCVYGKAYTKQNHKRLK